MLNWLKRNLYLVYFVAAFVALSLVIVPIYNTVNALGNTDSSDYQMLLWMNLSNYVCIAIAEIIFIVLASRRDLDKTLLMCAIILFFASDVLVDVYRIIEYQEYSSIYYILIDVALIIFMIMSLSNRRYFLSTVIILLMRAATSLLGTFTGSSIELSKLILDFMLLFAIYFYGNYNQIDDSYNTYS